MSSVDIDKVNLALPAYEIDQIIFNKTYQLSVSNAIGIYLFDSILNDIEAPGVWGLPVGIYSYDGGVSWEDIGIKEITTNQTYLPSVELVARSDSDGGLTVTIEVFATVGGGGTIPITLSLSLIARDEHTIFDQTLTGDEISYISTGNYQKILSRGTVTDDNTFYTIPHGLNYVPSFRFWDYSHLSSPQAVSLGDNFLTFAKIDATNLYFDFTRVPGTGNKYIYRLYYEE